MDKTERNEYIASQVRAGRTFVDIAKEVGLTATRVRTIAIETGAHVTRHYGRRSDSRRRAHQPAGAMDSRNTEILKLVREGYSYKEIGDMYGLTRARIGMIVKDYGEPTILDKQKKSRAARKRKIVREAAKQGIPSTKLAEEHGHTPKYWEKVARQNGVQIIKENGKLMRGSSAAIAKRNARICKYLEQGHTQAEACKKFGLSQVAISGIALNNGIRRRLTGDLLAERNKQIVADIESGMMEREVAEKYGLSVCSVSLIYAGRNVEIKKHDDLDARNQAILNDVTAGLSRREVAERNHVSIQTVNAVLGSLNMRGKEGDPMPVVEWGDDGATGEDGGLEISVNDDAGATQGDAEVHEGGYEAGYASMG